MAKVKQEALTQLNNMMTHLNSELNTVNVPHSVRIALTEQLCEAEKEFESIAAGKHSSTKLTKKLAAIDCALAHAVIEQAENEISKMERRSAQFQGLENVMRLLNEKGITPNQARHEVKKITRRI